MISEEVALLNAPELYALHSGDGSPYSTPA